MPRNGAGVYTLPQAPFTPNTTISSSAVDSDFSDIAAQLTNSLAADGQTTMTGAIKAASGSAPSPSYTFGSNTNTGFYSAGANVIGIAANGVSVGTLGASGFVGNFAGAITGVVDGSSAAPGIVGEYLSAAVQSGSAVPLTANVNANVTSLSIPAGDWDVWGDCYFKANYSDTAGAYCFAALSTVSAVFPTVLPMARGMATDVINSGGGYFTSVTGLCIWVSVASPTTYFLVANCNDTLNAAGSGAFGQIQARRRR